MSFRFENPVALWGLLAVLLLVLIQGAQRAGHPESFSWRRWIFTFVGFSFGVLALARPQAGSYELRQSQAKGEVYFAIDISRSMMAEDTLPNRLQFAATFVEKLLQEVPEFKVSVFPFAADGFVQMPLSSDKAAAVDLLKGLSPTLTTDQGTDLETTLDTLSTVLSRRQDNAQSAISSQVVLMSDGETHREVSNATLDKYRKLHVPVYTIGIGTTSGSQIVTTLHFDDRPQILRDKSGKPVVTKLDKEPLERVARGTQGQYLPGRLDQIPVLAQRLKQRVSYGGLQSSFQVRREFFPEMLLISLILLAMELFAVRWQYLVRVLLAGIFFLSAPALMAEEFREEQSPRELLKEKSGEPRAIEAYNKGLTLLEGGNLVGAADLFLESAHLTKSPELAKKALYNLGNSYLRQRDPVQAIVAYQLAIDTKSPNEKEEKDTNERASSNIVLAARIQKQMSQSQANEGKPDDKNGGQPQDKGKPDDFKGQKINPKKIEDLVSQQDREVRSRLQKQNQQQKGLQPTGKEW